jgi:hypothetical protein
MRKSLLAACAVSFAMSAFVYAQSTPPAASGKPTNAEAQAKEHITQKDPGDNMAVSNMNSFDSMDSGKKGMVSRDQAKADPWLMANFKTCDKNSDAMVTREEYAGCRAIR